MTEAYGKATKKKHPKGHSHWLLWGICLCLFLLLLLHPDESLRGVLRGIRLCVEHVIPALFPFMIVSTLTVSSGLLSPLARLLRTPMRVLFGISGEGGSVVLLGLLCGFPVATSSALSLYEEGRIGRRELGRLMTFANNPSPGFLIGGVGTSLMGDRALGLILYGVTVLSALFIGILSRWLPGDTEPPESPLTPAPPNGRSPLSLFTDSVTSSAHALLSVCSFVVFFAVLTDLGDSLLGGLSPSAPLLALLFGGLEMTGGMARAATCSAPVSYYLAATLAGWTGLSIHFQLFSICAGYPVSPRSYLGAKLTHALLNPLFMGVALRIFGYV